MNQGKLGPVMGMGYGLAAGMFVYYPNGASNPVLASVTGGLARFISTITHSALGTITIVFTSDFSWATAPRFFCTPTIQNAANYYDVFPVGQYNAATKTLVLMQVQAGVAFDVPADPTASVSVMLLASDTTGK